MTDKKATVKEIDAICNTSPDTDGCRDTFAATGNPEMSIKTALEVLGQAMRDDPDYAWGWLSNISCSFQDAGGDHETANKGACRFMKLAFGIDLEQRVFDEFKYKVSELLDYEADQA